MRLPEAVTSLTSGLKPCRRKVRSSRSALARLTNTPSCTKYVPAGAALAGAAAGGLAGGAATGAVAATGTAAAGDDAAGEGFAADGAAAGDDAAGGVSVTAGGVGNAIGAGSGAG